MQAEDDDIRVSYSIARKLLAQHTLSGTIYEYSTRPGIPGEYGWVDLFRFLIAVVGSEPLVGYPRTRKAQMRALRSPIVTCRLTILCRPAAVLSKQFRVNGPGHDLG